MQRELSTERERRHGIELRLSELDNESSRIREHLLEALSVEVETLGALDDEDFDSETMGQRVHQLRTSIQRLGSVHVGVLEEFEEQKERRDFLVQHRDDLQAAAADLRKSLQFIDRTARQMFRSTFDEIREKFRHTYTRFFPGGEADLVLQHDVDPLESTIGNRRPAQRQTAAEHQPSLGRREGPHGDRAAVRDLSGQTEPFLYSRRSRRATR